MFDKLWLESTINTLYNNGLKNDMLNLLYIENKKANIALKFNNRITRRTQIEKIVMQGTIFSSFMCASEMDNINTLCNNNQSLKYYYQGDPNIDIGFLNFVDDQLGISECYSSAAKNAAICSFAETRKQQLCNVKSSSLHIGNSKNCKKPCPQLKVHDESLIRKDASKYLGVLFNDKGNMKNTIEQRRNKGWGLIPMILSYIESIQSNQVRIQVGLQLRDSILVSTLLHSLESISNISESNIERLEQVDDALLREILGSHTKGPKVFPYLELGVLRLRYILMYHRILYLHHIILLDDCETLKKNLRETKVIKFQRRFH